MLGFATTVNLSSGLVSVELVANFRSELNAIKPLEIFFFSPPYLIYSVKVSNDMRHWNVQDARHRKNFHFFTLKSFTESKVYHVQTRNGKKPDAYKNLWKHPLSPSFWKKKAFFNLSTDYLTDRHPPPPSSPPSYLPRIFSPFNF